MPMSPPSLDNRRLADFLLDPRETLDIEIKGWLDLAHSEEHKATLAKALLAMANHGGGRVILGLREDNSAFTTDSEAPATLDAYTQDAINGIVKRYAEPAFHCSVHHIRHPSSGCVHPIIGVPGGHRAPIRAKRNGPNNNIVKVHAVYIRRPGPESAEPLTAREWEQLFTRCVVGQRDELLDQIRNIVLGVPRSLPEDSSNAIPALGHWTQRCDDAWKQRIETLPSDSPGRLPRGSYTFAYHVDGATRLSLADLLDVLRQAPRLTGWSTWLVPSLPAISPSPVDGTIECWIDGDDRDHPEPRAAALSDFWRVSPDGFAFLRRGYQEDGDHAAAGRIAPGTCLDAILPIWRVGEALLHAAYLAGRLDGAMISFNARYTGLSGRRLVKWVRPMEFFGWAGGVSQDDSVTLTTHADASTVTANLVDVVHSLLSPLHERFNFTRLPVDIVRHELKLLRDLS